MPIEAFASLGRGLGVGFSGLGASVGAAVGVLFLGLGLDPGLGENSAVNILSRCFLEIFL